MAEKRCDNCGELTEVKHLRKIRKRFLCKECSKQIKKQHREETIEKAGISKELKTLDKKIKREYAKNYRKQRTTKKAEPPIPKGNKITKKQAKNNCYLTFQEKQILLKQLVRKGVIFKDAKERIQNLVEEERRIKKQLEEKHISKEKMETELKTKQQKLLEDLWKY